MPLFGPNFANVLATAENAQDQQAQLQQQLINNALLKQKLAKEQNDFQQQQVAQARQARVKAMIAQAYQQAGINNQRSFQPFSPAQAQPAFAPGSPGVSAAGTPQVPGAGGAPGGPMPQAQAAFPQGNKGAALAPVNLAQSVSWSDILDILQAKTGADPQDIHDAISEIMPEVDKESARQAKSDEERAKLDEKRWEKIQTLQWLRDRTQSQSEQKQYDDQIKYEIAQMGDVSRERVAEIGATSRENVASTQAGSRERVAEIGTTSRETIAKMQADLKKQLGDRAQDLKEEEVEGTIAYHNRLTDLKARGMSDQEAQFQAKLDLQQALANQRDETIRRGQDFLKQRTADIIAGQNKRQQATQDFKTSQQQLNQSVKLDGAIDLMDKTAATAKEMLTMPGFDTAFGTIAGAGPAILPNSVNLRKKLEQLKSQLSIDLVNQLRAASTTGSSGFGRITNMEVQLFSQINAALDPRLSPDMMRKSLNEVITSMQKAKSDLLDQYKKDQTPAKGTGGGVRTSESAQGTIPTPKSAQGFEDGDVYNYKGHQYRKQSGGSSIDLGPV